MEDYYALLEVSRDASDKQIKIAYRKKIIKYHPDRNKSPEAESIAKLVNQAYNVLSDPIKREEYDLQFFAFRPPTRNYTSPNSTPQETWHDPSVHQQSQSTWTFTGTRGRSRVRKIRVETSDGYYDIEFTING